MNSKLRDYKKERFQNDYYLFSKQNDLDDICNYCMNARQMDNPFIYLRKYIKGNINILPFYLLENEDIALCCLNFVILALIQNRKYNFNYVNDRGQTILQSLLSTNFTNKDEIASLLIKTLSENNYKIDINYKDYKGDSILDYICDSKLIKKRENLDNISKIISREDNQDLMIRYNLVQTQNITKQLVDIRTDLLNVTKALKTIADKQNENIEDMKNPFELYDEFTNDFEILNDRVYKTKLVGRKQEMQELIMSLAQKKKTPLLVGESGVGKTSMIDMLVYMIQNNEVPDFLKGQVIIEINPNSMVAGTRYRGDFEQKMKDVLDLCVQHNAIIFIDEIHLIYGAGNGSNQTNDMASIIKYYIDRYNLKVIGATITEEYNKYFASDALKRRFDRVRIDEPDEKMLYDIINQVLINNGLEYNISISELLDEYPNIIDTLIKVTNPKCRVQTDKVNNPDLVVGILDKAFAYAVVNDAFKLEFKHLEKSIESCSKIYSSSKELFYRSAKKKEVQYIKMSRR